MLERIREVDGRVADLRRIAEIDCPELLECGELLHAFAADVTASDLRMRMLFSCLVDADRIDSSGCSQTGGPLSAASRLDQVLGFIQRRAAEVRDGLVKRARMDVLAACLAAAGRPGNIFSLTVHTGGAKTLASMAFALKRAVAYPEVRRIIVVIPYLSIIEQNAQVFIDALGADAILEHHSGDTDATKTRMGTPTRAPPRTGMPRSLSRRRSAFSRACFLIAPPTCGGYTTSRAPS